MGGKLTPDSQLVEQTNISIYKLYYSFRLKAKGRYRVNRTPVQEQANHRPA